MLSSRNQFNHFRAKLIENISSHKSQTDSAIHIERCVNCNWDCSLFRFGFSVEKGKPSTFPINNKK